MTAGMDREETGEARRRALVEVAARVLVEHGPQGLTLRRVAAEAGGSTQLVYTLFGGKPGLVDALYAEGFRRMAAARDKDLETGPRPGDPARLVACGRAYRAFARAEPAFFSLMFGSVPGFTPSRATRLRGLDATFGVLVQTVQDCLDAGTLLAGSAADLARVHWATVHGLTSLEQACLLDGDVESIIDSSVHVPDGLQRPELHCPR